MSFSTCSAGALPGPDFCFIFAPCGYDEPEILPSESPSICLMCAVGEHPEHQKLSRGRTGQRRERIDDRHPFFRIERRLIDAIHQTTVIHASPNLISGSRAFPLLMESEAGLYD